MKVTEINRLYLGTVFTPTLTSTAAFVVGTLFGLGKTVILPNTNNQQISNAKGYSHLHLIASATPASGGSINWYVQFSNDGVIWGQETSRTVSAGTSTDTPTIHNIASATPLAYAIPILGDYIRFGAEPVTGTTGAVFSLQADLVEGIQYAS